MRKGAGGYAVQILETAVVEKPTDHVYYAVSESTDGASVTGNQDGSTCLRCKEVLQQERRRCRS